MKEGEIWAMIFVGIAALFLILEASNAAVEKRETQKSFVNGYVVLSDIVNDHNTDIGTLRGQTAKAQITADNALLTAKQALTKASEKENVVRYEANAYCLITHNDTHATLGCRKW